MKYYLILVCLSTIFISETVLAQGPQSTFNLNYIPPSPSAAALGKFGEFPVSMSTGIPSISVPMFNYKGNNNGLSLNVSLDYHAGGVRVEEVASNVGIGWALNAGGVISRTMRSLPDDLNSYGYIALHPATPPSFTIGGNNTIAENYLKNAYDGEQDEFNFNFNGHSGKFILDGLGHPILITRDALKIQPLRGSGPTGLPFIGFVITDESGVKYIFKDMETTTASLSTVQPTITYASSYYISSIINPTSRDTIRFSYNNSYNNMFNFGSESASNWYNNSGGVSGTEFTEPMGTYSTQTGKKIKSIEFPDHTEIDFLYNPLSRCDLKGDSTLTEVRQRNIITGQYKSFTLYQSYINNYGLILPYSPAPCDMANLNNATTLRLRLDSIIESAAGATLKPYKFIYNDTYVLPETNSTHQDFWGFYNGNVNISGHLVPQYLYHNGYSNTSYMLEGADRRADSNAVSACALTKMVYPTGGFTQFDYEANRAGDNKLVFNYLQNNNVSIGSDSPTQSFTLNRQPANQPVDFNFMMTLWCPQTAQNGCSFIYKIKSADNSVTYVTESFMYSELNTTKTATLNLPNGTYNLTWELSSGCSCSDGFGFNMGFVTNISDSTQMGGGIRIKKITNYDGINHANDVVKQYRYVNANGTSSGYAADLPEYSYQYSDCIGSDPDYQTIQYLARTATTNAPLTFSSGGINYSRVEVANTGPVNQGKEVDYFTSYKDYPPMGNPDYRFQFPFAPLQNKDWNLGLQTQQGIYDSNGYIKKRIYNIYANESTGLLDTLLNYKVGKSYLGSCGSQLYPAQYVINRYEWIVGRTDKVQSTTVDYSIAGDSLVTNHWYNYNPNYFTLSNEKTTNSRGDTLVTNHYYPFDYAINGSVLPAMVDSNMIARPVSNEYWKYTNGNWVLTGADAINYGLFNISSYLPSQYYTLSASTPVPAGTIGSFNPSALLRVPSLYETAITFNTYDGKANPLQVVKRNGPPTTYLWGYNKEYPIAEISNATYTNVENALGGFSVVNSFSNRPMPIKADIDTYLAPLHSGLNNALIKSYVYDTFLGMTSQTDPKGQTTYYEYDSFQRLMNVKDKDGNIIKHTDYHYQNQ